MSLLPNRKGRKSPDDETPDLPFSESLISLKPKHATYEGRVWTRNKAQLIARYLEKFLFVTGGGQYIDLFAGPQHDGSRDGTWAAKLVLENCRPDRLRRAYLFELNSKSVARLMELKRLHGRNWRLKSTRKVEVIEGDSNQKVREYFAPGNHSLRPKLPAFCLLDQRNRECDWSTVEFVSKLKQEKCKVELFYFLTQGWADRHWHLIDKHPEVKDRVRAWWGNDNWTEFQHANAYDRGLLMERRFREELNYRYAQAFPIYSRGNTGRVQFYMVHASDDSRALPLMGQAYREIGLNLKAVPADQLKLDSLWATDEPSGGSERV